MSAPASTYWQKKASKQFLRLTFEEDDDILEGIESALREHNIGEAALVECKGKLKSGVGNYLQGSQLMSNYFNNTEIKIETGHFKVSKKGMLGILKFIPTDLDSHVTIAKAKRPEILKFDCHIMNGKKGIEMKIVIGSNHAGFEFKNQISRFLEQKKF